MNVEDDSQVKRERRERILAYVVGVPLIVFVLAYELFGWLPPIPRGVLSGMSLFMQTGFALLASAVMTAWVYLFTAWIKHKRARIIIAVAVGLYVGFDGTFNPGISPDLLDCRPAGQGIYNDC